MKKLYFVRHGQTEWNAIRRMQGRWNSDLNGLGRIQADTNGQLLRNENIEAIYASPLDRTRQTADIINRYLKLPIQYDDRIMEWDCGDWSGEMYDDIVKKWPTEWAARQANKFHHRAPNGENYPDMIERSAPFLDEIMEREEQHIAIVSHGLIGKIMAAHLCGLGNEEMLDLSQDNDVIFQITINKPPEPRHFACGAGPFDGLVPAY